MAKKPAVKNAPSPVKITAAMKRAGAVVIEASPELYPGELAGRIFAAMAKACPA
jgi:hypothetical protein